VSALLHGYPRERHRVQTYVVTNDINIDHPASPSRLILRLEAEACDWQLSTTIGCSAARSYQADRMCDKQVVVDRSTPRLVPTTRHRSMLCGRPWRNNVVRRASLLVAGVLVGCASVAEARRFPPHRTPRIACGPCTRCKARGWQAGGLLPCGSSTDHTDTGTSVCNDVGPVKLQWTGTEGNARDHRCGWGRRENHYSGQVRRHVGRCSG
jgi:hypothetical protein